MAFLIFMPYISGTAFFFVALHPESLVEKFVLIATTGKNAKTAYYSFFTITNF